MPTYRVWIETRESGWVEVTADCEETAKDRAQYVAESAQWYPEHSQTTPCAVELISAVVRVERS